MMNMKMKMMKARKVHGTALEQASEKPSSMDQHYETQGHMKTITDAFDILQDPEKMKRVHALAGRHKNAIKSLGDLKLARDNFEEKGETTKDNEAAE